MFNIPERLITVIRWGKITLGLSAITALILAIAISFANAVEPGEQGATSLVCLDEESAVKLLALSDTATKTADWSAVTAYMDAQDNMCIFVRDGFATDDGPLEYLGIVLVQEIHVGEFGSAWLAISDAGIPVYVFVRHEEQGA
jgi:hypothetical protein